VKKLQSDSKKLRELMVKHKGMQEGAIRLVSELTEAEEEIERLEEKVNELRVVLIEQRGVIEYLEHKLKGENDEPA
jgi:SMC interacting uncharacterized protein involved in chromosome segregation